jgi:hypothetical protein
MPLTSGTHSGSITRVAAAAVTRGQLLKNDAGKVTPCTADTDIALFVALDDAEANANVPCGALGGNPGTHLVLATDAIAIGDRIGVLGAAQATQAKAIVGRALEAGAAGELVEFDPCVCVLNP